MSAAATEASPTGKVPAQLFTWRRGGSVRVIAFARKQLLLPDPRASARSALPLPRTALPNTRFPRGRQGGPGSAAPGSKTTKRAVGKTAMPYR